MADNVQITAGSGTTIAADDVGGGVLYQRVKLGLGADGSATDALGGAGAVAAGVQRVTLASDDPVATNTSRLLSGALPTAGGTATSTTAQAVGGTYNSTPITLTNTQQAGVQLDVNGRLLTTTRVQDGAGTALTSATRGSEQALSVQIVDGSGSQITTFGTGVTLGAGAVDSTTTRTVSATDDPVVATLGAKTDAKSTATDTTAVSAISVLKQISSSAQALVTALGGTLDLGAGTVGTNTQRVTIGTDDATAVNINNALVGDYEPCAASGTTTLGATGATGDYLASVIIVPSSVDAEHVQIKDGSGTAIDIFAGGTGSLTNLVPFAIPVGAKSAAGAWQIVVGAGVTAIGVGNFT